MSHVLAKIKGAKIEDVKRALHADAWRHAQNGLTIEHVWQNDDDPEEVQFLFGADDLDKAKKFVAETHEAARKQNPNATLPSMTFLAGEDDFEFDVELPEGEDKKEEESKDVKQQSPAPQQQTFSIKNISLTVGGLTVGLGLGYAASLSTPNACPAPITTTTTPIANTPQVKTNPTTPRSTTPAVAAPVKTESSPAPVGSSDATAGAVPTPAEETLSPRESAMPSTETSTTGE